MHCSAAAFENGSSMRPMRMSRAREANRGASSRWIRRADGRAIDRSRQSRREASPPVAEPVAWLHEVFERTAVREQDLLASGLTDEELRALRLLTRPIESRSEATYLAHIDLIARSSGPGGDLARAVKRADLEDRLSTRAGVRMVGIRPTNSPSNSCSQPHRKRHCRCRLIA